MKFVWSMGLAAVLLSRATPAATYYISPSGVDTSGNDTSGNGSATQPWRSIQLGLSRVKAGDTLLISPGDYAEYVQTLVPATATQRITIAANTGGTSGARPELRAIRLNHPYYTVEGLTFKQASDSHRTASSAWSASVRIEPTAHNSIIRSNIIRDTPTVIASDFIFDSVSNTIQTATGDFVAAGFKPQSHVFLGSCSLIPFTNHNTGWLVSKLTKNTLWVTNLSNTRFSPDGGSNYWAAVHAGDTAAGMSAIAFMPKNSLGATNCHIVGNSISNNFGSALDLFGDGHVIERNNFTKLYSFYGARIYAKNITIRSNSWINLPTIVWYTPSELEQIPHPPGSGWFDYQDGTFHSAPSGISVTNILFEYNWVENSENQLGTCGFEKSSHTAIYRNNVFIGVGSQHNNGRHNMQWINNTFYKCSYDVSRSIVIATGGSSPSTIMDRINISSNLFIACGDHSKLDIEGFYTVTQFVTNLVTSANFVAGPEVTGWIRRKSFSEPDGINGGDPLFVDEFNPLGPDGLPFTADDGLRPLPNSVAATRKIGALEPLPRSSNSPIAHFSVAAPTAWHEPVRGKYDPEWLTKTPWERKGPQRPFGTVDSLPEAPCTITFTAAGSWSEPSDPIDSFKWVFGDGTTAQTTTPQVDHTFGKRSGEFYVELTVRSRSGKVSTTRRRYRFLASTSLRAPQAPVGVRVILN